MSATAWLALGLLTMHNAEEAVALSHYLPQLASSFPAPFTSFAAALSYMDMLLALAVVQVLALVVTLTAAVRPRSPGALWAFLTLEAVLALNAVAHLLIAVVLLHGYTPGLATALLVNAPFAGYCFRRARREQWLSAAALRATVPAALLLHGPVLVGGLWFMGSARH